MLKFYVAAPAADKGAISCLFENLDLIIGNKAKILSHNKYKNIKIPGIFVGGLYVGMYNMLLGDILNIWDKTKWHDGTKYYYNIIGTPLSGMNNCSWYDTETKSFEHGSYFNGKSHFLGLAAPALKYMTKHQKVKKQSDLTIFDLIKQLQ